MGLYRNRYRIESTRLPQWDYSSDGAYFITVCVQDWQHVFGQVRDGVMQHSPLGKTALACWQAIPVHFPFAIADVFVAMPNHVHGIVIIDWAAYNQRNAGGGNADNDDNDDNDGNDGNDDNDGNDGNDVETQNFASLHGHNQGHGHNQHNHIAWLHNPVTSPLLRVTPASNSSRPTPGLRRPGPNRFGPQSQNLASIMRGFKIGVTRYAREHDIAFAWQPRYHDSIIHTDASYQRVRRYILNNPHNWRGHDTRGEPT